jgi:hypothetical protein
MPFLSKFFLCMFAFSFHHCIYKKSSCYVFYVCLLFPAIITAKQLFIRCECSNIANDNRSCSIYVGVNMHLDSLVAKHFIFEGERVPCCTTVESATKIVCAM